MEDIDYDTLMESEWKVLTPDKIFSLVAALDDWKDNRQRGGYDIRLIDGCIAVCKSWLVMERE